MSLSQVLFMIFAFFMIWGKLDSIKDRLDRIEAKLDKEREGK